jgi:hypothetical protein
MIVVESLSQRTETDEAMHPRTVPAASKPRHRLDLIFNARMVIVLEPFGKIDDRGRHQHDPRLLPDLAVQLIQLFSQLVAIARIEERPSNIAPKQIVAGIELVRHGIDLGRLHVSQYVVLLRRQVRFAELLVYLLIQKQLDALDRHSKREVLGE